MHKNLFSPDFQDFIAALNHASVAYILVGGYSVILNGYYRTTGDLDVWVDRTPENYARLVTAFAQFGMPIFDMSLKKFLENQEYDVFTFGRPPVSIDVLTAVKGLDFQNCFEKSHWFQIEEHLQVRALDKADLIAAKRASGRTKDQNDIEHLDPDGIF
jgi:hypothetical protein